MQILNNAHFSLLLTKYISLSIPFSKCVMLILKIGLSKSSTIFA